MKYRHPHRVRQMLANKFFAASGDKLIEQGAASILGGNDSLHGLVN